MRLRYQSEIDKAPYKHNQNNCKIMTVNETIEKLQQMITDGEITGSEPFGLFEFTIDNRYVYSEAECIGLEVNWKEFGNNVVYIE